MLPADNTDVNGNSRDNWENSTKTYQNVSLDPEDACLLVNILYDVKRSIEIKKEDQHKICISSFPDFMRYSLRSIAKNSGRTQGQTVSVALQVGYDILKSEEFPVMGKIESVYDAIAADFCADQSVLDTLGGCTIHLAGKLSTDATYRIHKDTSYAISGLAAYLGLSKREAYILCITVTLSGCDRIQVPRYIEALRKNMDGFIEYMELRLQNLESALAQETELNRLRKENYRLKKALEGECNV